MGTAGRAQRRRWIDLSRLRPERVLAALREPGALVNIASRLLILAFTIDALINAGDDRFAGKALGPRNVGIMLGFSMLFPLVYLVAKRWRRYPWEYYGDVLLGTHNVRGIADSINDLAYGLGGMVVYTIVFKRFGFTRRRRTKPDKGPYRG